MPTTGEAAHRSIWGYDDPAIWADYVTGSPTPKDYPAEDGAGDAQPLADFLAARDWGLLRFAETQPDSSPHGRTVLQLLFAGRDEDDKFPIDSDDAAALAYESIVEYLEKHGHNHDAHLERIGIFKIVYGGFRRFKDDLKHDLKKRAKGDPFTGAQPPVNQLINRDYDNRRRRGDAANMENIWDQLIRADQTYRRRVRACSLDPALCHGVGSCRPLLAHTADF